MKKKTVKWINRAGWIMLVSLVLHPLWTIAAVIQDHEQSLWDGLILGALIGVTAMALTEDGNG